MSKAHIIKNLLGSLPIILMVSISFVSPLGRGYTASGNEYQTSCAELSNATWEGAPSPLAILCTIARLINVIVYSSAAVFIIMILASAIKYAMAQGDPKALQGAKSSLTWSIIGFIVIFSVFTLLVILKNVLGLNDSPILNPIETLNNNLIDLLDRLGITGY